MTETTETTETTTEPPDARAYCELHLRSAFSFLRGAGAVEALAVRASALGMPALALTDFMTLAGSVRFQAACQARGTKAILGTELAVADPRFGDSPFPGTLVALAQNRTGYARLCHLLTEANLAAPPAPRIPFAALADEPEGLIVLTGGRDGQLARLVLAGRVHDATELARRYRDTFGVERVWIELQHHRLLDSTWLMQHLVWIAETVGLRVVATNGVRHTQRADLPLYDVLTCIRLGIGVDQPHAERPRNDEAHLKGGVEMAQLFTAFPWGRAALAASQEIAMRCDLSLLRGVCRAPQVPVPAGETPLSHLRQLCAEGIARRYASTPAALAAGSPQRRQLDHELDVIARLELAEFFLCVHEIIAAARGMGIRCSGRGSAANSLVAYCLGITGVDPLEHRLLFERFLNPERAGMPDIDIDVQSDRRDELIRYVERTYSERHAAMVANVITYRPRSALRDSAKALGYPLPLINQLTKVLHQHSDAEQMGAYREELAQVIARLAADGAAGGLRARCLERLPLLLELAPRLVGLPRHLSLHNGGLVLTREPLTSLLPVRLSANGVRALEVDKDDVERLGLIKFDLLGLRT
ncbi:MAG TPA: PHP domain-containing protein, partial [Ktedonobacterales bacterium]|nr:PHP domain-containing protein [Ktedonobacterales bacterium]